MGLLDGDLQGVFGAIFSPLFIDATLHTDRKQAIVGGRPTGPVTWTDTPAHGMIDSFSEGYRARNGIPDTDVKLIVLQAGVNAVPTTDSEITIRAKRYKLITIMQDPAMASWEMRGRPIG
ncbi:hypothetical protein [Aureimonas psammosilenae]|uniref:hypothetical protein n=1 Tax=Aureimonas psammosilenae TaxID=2495496 RepID=UPI001261307A|nr:hypothetical protein [Aureimonas psammosilenae]